jgi:hypothetical protein
VRQRHLGHVAEVLHQVLAAVGVGRGQDGRDSEEDQWPGVNVTILSIYS